MKILNLRGVNIVLDSDKNSNMTYIMIESLARDNYVEFELDKNELDELINNLISLRKIVQNI